jgi:threonine dehydrogenase-like Zn-dependent dehydrogenase
LADVVGVAAAVGSAGQGWVYLRRLLTDGQRKSMQPMTERLRDGSSGVQRFITSSTWDSSGCWAGARVSGVDVAIDAVAGPGVNTIVRAVAPGGMLVVYGFLDPSPVPLPIAPDFRGRNTRTYAFTEVTRDEPELRRAERFINAGLRSGSFAPVIDRTFDLTDVVQAHRYLESSAQVGKIVPTVQQ